MLRLVTVKPLCAKTGHLMSARSTTFRHSLPSEKVRTRLDPLQRQSAAVVTTL